MLLPDVALLVCHCLNHCINAYPRSIANVSRQYSSWVSLYVITSGNPTMAPAFVINEQTRQLPLFQLTITQPRCKSHLIASQGKHHYPDH